MWTYLARRLLVMLPTLFGVTVISFLIMQLAPGDPLKAKLGVAGMASQSGQSHEAYLVQKRDLHLDKPILLNFNYFRDYSAKVGAAAHYLSLDQKQLVTELSQIEEHPDEDDRPARLAFLRSLAIKEFQEQLADPKRYERLAEQIQGFTRIFCEDTGASGVPAAIELLESPDTSPQDKIGLIQCLSAMVVDPFAYTYSRNPADGETAEIVELWKLWWQRAEAADKRLAAKKLPLWFPPLPPERIAALAKRFAATVAAPDRAAMFAEMEFFDPVRYEPFAESDMRFFVEKLLGQSSLQEKVAAAAVLGGTIGQPLETNVPADASAELVGQVADNWLLHYRYRRAQYEPGLAHKLWSVVADTQYAHMVWRLATFDFGRSNVRTREPVAGAIWSAVLVSAPLMLLSELLIYVVAVPLGVLCAVKRGSWTDRLISFGLFLLYSVPPFVAGMLFLMYFCYGDYLRLFPMEGLHSDWAGNAGPARFAVDYLWHIVLPVVCLALFSLAGMAMYARSSMLDVIGQDYIRTARAKGLPESKVIFKHALRNALIPIITLFATFLPAMLGGSVLIEVIFGIPGMGRLSWDSIDQKDIPMLMALVYLEAILVMLSILLTDILYVLVDPRISFEGQGHSA